jgi:hypothetical protein
MLLGENTIKGNDARSDSETNALHATPQFTTSYKKSRKLQILDALKHTTSDKTRMKKKTCKRRYQNQLSKDRKEKEETKTEQKHTVTSASPRQPSAAP